MRLEGYSSGRFSNQSEITLISVNTRLTSLFARVRADQSSSQLLEFLSVTEQGEQANDERELVGRGYLEFRHSHNEDEAKNRGSQYEGHAGDK